MLRTADKRLFLGQGLRDIIVDPHSEYGDRLTAGPEFYASEVLSDSPAVFWKMQEASGAAQDASGNGRHSTSTTGTPDYGQTGPMTTDLAIQFVDAEHFNINVFSTATDNITLEAFIKNVSGSGANVWRNGTGASDGYGWAFNGASTLRGVAHGVAFLSDGPNIGTGTWTHFVMVRRSGTWEYYTDGVQTTANAGTNAPNTPTGSFRTGAFDATRTVHLAYVAFYTSALSSARIAAHYASTGL